ERHREVVGSGAADDLHPAAAVRGLVDLHVGAAPRRRFGAAGVRPPLRAPTAVGPLAAVERVVPAGADQVIVPGPAVDLVRPAVADQRVAEGRAFEVLEAEELVVAVAAGTVLRQRGPDPGPLAARHRGREGGDVVLARPAGHAVV